MTGINTNAVVIVATIKALKHHGGLTKDTGFGNLDKHVENIRLFGLEPVIAINRFTDDTDDELKTVVNYYEKQGIKAVVAEHYEKGGKGAIDLAKAVIQTIELNKGKKVNYLYPLEAPVKEKIETIAKSSRLKIYSTGRNPGKIFFFTPLSVTTGFDVNVKLISLKTF